MTFEQRFSKIKAKFAEADTSVITKPFAIQIVMSDEDCGGIYYIAYRNGVFACEPYNYYEHTAEIIGPAAEIEKVICGRCGAEKAAAAGKVIINGLMDDIITLAATVKKPAAKKTAAKAAPKKAAAKKADK
ncbi:MAG: hypothetical protein IJZ90_01135 [Clostridia bacterium]|nr:hypothetical protein [Clostridia bacterium]